MSLRSRYKGLFIVIEEIFERDLNRIIDCAAVSNMKTIIHIIKYLFGIVKLSFFV